VLGSELELWYHLRDIHSTLKSNIGKKRQRQWDEDEEKQVEASGAAKKKQSRFKGRIESQDAQTKRGQKSTLKGKPKNSVGRAFVNISALDFDQGP
jgi:hypothetical protein